jgi:hypothetical protein
MDEGRGRKGTRRTSLSLAGAGCKAPEEETAPATDNNRGVYESSAVLSSSLSPETHLASAA